MLNGKKCLHTDIMIGCFSCTVFKFVGEVCVWGGGEGGNNVQWWENFFFFLREGGGGGEGYLSGCPPSV